MNFKTPNLAEGWRQPAAALWLGTCTFLALAMVAALNVVVNPFQLYGPERFDAATVNYRVYKLELARQLKPPPATLIVGSSRVMTMNPRDVERYLPGPCFNFGMQGAMAEDYLAALRAVSEQAGAPCRALILAIDLEAFNPGTPLMYESRSAPEFNRYIDLDSAGGQPGGLSYALSMLLSPEQSNESMMALRRQERRALDEESIKIEPNGYARMRWRENAIAAGTFHLDRIIARRVRKYPERSLHLSQYTAPSPTRLAYLEHTLLYCEQHDIAVYAYLTAYHPALWRVLDAMPKAEVLQQARLEIGEVCAAHGVELRDFSRIESFGGDAELFYDEIHLQPSNQARILAALLGGGE